MFVIYTHINEDILSNFVSSYIHHNDRGVNVTVRTRHISGGIGPQLTIPVVYWSILLFKRSLAISAGSVSSLLANLDQPIALGMV